MALTGSDGLLLVIILVTIAVVVIAGLWAIARIQKKKKYDTLTAVLMILVIFAVGFLLSALISIVT